MKNSCDIIYHGDYMINFVVLDDNKIHRKNICDTIVKTMMSNQANFKINEFEDYSEKLLNYIKKDTHISVYILDLELPNGDGIDIARKIRNTYNNWNSPIIIITAHDSLYYEVYKQRLQILDFIPKFNSTEKSLSEDIEICLKMLSKEKVYKYVYKNIEYNIKINSINYIQRDGRRTKIVTKNKTYYQNITINEIKKFLPNYFVISAKGTLLNMKNVHEIDWNSMIVSFDDNSQDYLVTNSHKRELESYVLD